MCERKYSHCSIRKRNYPLLGTQACLSLSLFVIFVYRSNSVLLYHDLPTIIMSFLNGTSTTPSSFILNGIPGLEEEHFWISFPLCTMFSIALTGNFGLMYLIYSEEALHRPMYIFLALLSFTDVLMCTSTLPNTLHTVVQPQGD